MTTRSETRNTSPRRHARISARAALLLGIALCGAARAADDPIVAERGQDHITASQARAMIASADPDTRARLAATPAALTDLLRNLLLQRAILQQAQADHFDQRQDVAALLQRAHDQVLSQSYLTAHAPLPPGFPTDADIQTAYDQNRADFMQPRGYHLAQLYAPKSTADGQKRLSTLRAQIQRTRLTFDAAAKQSTGVQSQDLGWLGEAQLVPAIRTAVAGLPEGGLSDIVCTDNGCHLLRLVATRPAGPAPLADVKDNLVRALRQQKQAELARAYATSLLQKQPVAVNEIELSRLAH